MTDRPAPPPSSTTRPVLPPPMDKTPGKKPKPDATPASKPELRPGREVSDAPTTAPGGVESQDGDTVVRPGFAERLQAKLMSAGAGLRPGDGGDDPAPTAAVPAAKSKPRGPRRARLRLTRIDPWSVMKTAFLLSIAFGVVTVVAVAMIWQVLNSAGVWDSINSTIRDVLDSQDTASFDVRDYVGTDRVLGFTMLVAAVDVVLLTAIATLGAFLYNMAAALLGGVEVTLAEDH